MKNSHSTLKIQKIMHSFFERLHGSIGNAPLQRVLCVLSLNGYLSLPDLRIFLDLLFSQSEPYKSQLDLVVYGGPLNASSQSFTRDTYPALLDSIQLIGGFTVDVTDDIQQALQSIPLQGRDLSGLLVLTETPFQPLPSTTFPSHMDLCLIQYENNQFKLAA